MSRPVTLCTSQWADLPFEVVCQKAKSFGYDGLELACWGDHFEVDKADEDYCRKKREMLDKYQLKVFSVSNHLVGQAVIRTGEAAKRLGISIVNGFTGSPIWHLVYSFPPVPPSMIEEGYAEFARRFIPILDAYQTMGIRFGLEVHPTEIAFDIASTKKALKAINNHPAFGFNYDPSHFGYQGVDYIEFIHLFSDRIFHVHMKDAGWSDVLVEAGVFGGHTEFGTKGRYWDFRSPGRGKINFEEIIRALNRIGYNGPLSVEWEDSGMDREQGAKEACEFVKAVDFSPSDIAFDSALKK